MKACIIHWATKYYNIKKGNKFRTSRTKVPPCTETSVYYSNQRSHVNAEMVIKATSLFPQWFTDMHKQTKSVPDKPMNESWKNHYREQEHKLPNQRNGVTKFNPLHNWKFGDLTRNKKSCLNCDGKRWTTQSLLVLFLPIELDQTRAAVEAWYRMWGQLRTSWIQRASQRPVGVRQETGQSRDTVSFSDLEKRRKQLCFEPGSLFKPQEWP
jgi:hypothetical protein